MIVSARIFQPVGMISIPFFLRKRLALRHDWASPVSRPKPDGHDRLFESEDGW